MTERNPSFPDKKTASSSFDKALDHIISAQKYKEERSVSQEEATWIPYGEYPEVPIGLTWMPDIHFSNLDVDYQILHEDLHTIASTPNMFVAFGGDMIDNFNPMKYPDGMLSDAIDPQDQIITWMEMLRTLDGYSKIAAIVWGNHEDFSKVAGHSLFQGYMRDLSCPIFADGGGVLNVVTEGARYRLGLKHTFWGNSKLNKTNAPKRMMQFGYDDLDAAFVGHVHSASGEMFQEAGRERIAVTGGTYKIHDRFAKRWGNNSELGGFTVLLYPQEKRMALYRRPQYARDAIMNEIHSLSDEPGWVDPYSQFIKQRRG